MLRIIDLMRIVGQWHEKKAFSLNVAAGWPNTAEDDPAADRTDRMGSRNPQNMTRADVQTDMDGMMRSFCIDFNILPYYRDELLEAESTCANCATVKRCWRWKHEGRRRDAPELFCPNAKLFSELAVDPFWTKEEEYDWPDNPTALPWLRVLKASPKETTNTPPDLGSGKLKAFAEAAARIDQIAREWAPHIMSAENSDHAEALRRKADFEMAMAIDQTGGISIDDFRTIYFVSLSDPEIACKLQNFLKDRGRM